MSQMWFHVDGDLVTTDGSVNQAELAKLSQLKMDDMRYGGHFFTRDFAREDLDRRREEKATLELLARFRAKNNMPAAAVSVSPQADQVETETEDGSSAAADIQGDPDDAQRTATGKSITWKDDEELEEYPLRILKGATGTIFHQTKAFVFAEFFDDEKLGEVVAAFDYKDIVVGEGQDAKTFQDNLRFQRIVFDAEKMMDSIAHGDVNFDYAAYHVHLQGKVNAVE